MTRDAMNTMEEMVRKDGPLSEERKSELLSVITTMKSEIIKLYKSHDEYAESMVLFNNTNEVIPWKKNK